MAIDLQKLGSIARKYTLIAAAVGGAAMVGAHFHTNDQEALEQRIEQYNDQAKDVLKQKADMDSSKFKPRQLTLPETELVHALFGSHFATETISIDRSPEEAKNGKKMQVFNEHPNRIFIYGFNHTSSDFSKNPDKMPSFVNQMTHVWHARHGIKIDSNAPTIETYVLDDNKRFMNYTSSQRATIMQDYAVVFMMGDNRPAAVQATVGFAQNVKAYVAGVPEDEERLALFKIKLATTVEAQFPDVRSYLDNQARKAQIRADAKAHYDALNAERAAKGPHNSGPKPIM